MIDVQTNAHVVAFPSKVASAMGTYGHVYNIVVTSDTLDNGSLSGRGDYVSFDNYKQTTVPAGFTGKILEKAPRKDSWYVEVTAVSDSADTLFLYNSAVSEYSERTLQDEKLFYNKKGDVMQGMTLIRGDIIELSSSAFDGTPVAKKGVTYVSGKYKVAS